MVDGKTIIVSLILLILICALVPYSLLLYSKPPCSNAMQIYEGYSGAEISIHWCLFLILFSILVAKASVITHPGVSAMVLILLLASICISLSFYNSCHNYVASGLSLDIVVLFLWAVMLFSDAGHATA